MQIGGLGRKIVSLTTTTLGDGLSGGVKLMHGEGEGDRAWLCSVCPSGSRDNAVGRDGGGILTRGVFSSK